MKSLSPKQRQALEAILRSLRQRGMPPILDEIAEAIGVKSRFGAFRQLFRQRFLVVDRRTGEVPDTFRRPSD